MLSLAVFAEITRLLSAGYSWHIIAKMINRKYSATYPAGGLEKLYNSASLNIGLGAFTCE